MCLVAAPMAHSQGAPSIVWQQFGVPNGNWTSATYSPNGKYFAIQNWFTLNIYTSSGVALQSIPLSSASSLEFTHIVWSPDSSTIAVSAAPVPITLITVATGQTNTISSSVQLGNWGGGGSPNVVFSPDGSTLVVAGTSLIKHKVNGTSVNTTGIIELWSTSTLKLLSKLSTTAAVGVNSAMFTADGKTLVVGGTTFTSNGEGLVGVLELWNVSTGKLISSLPTQSEVGVLGAVISPDGKWIASSGGIMVPHKGFSPTLEIWSLTKPGAPTELATKATNGESYATPLVFSPDSSLLIAYSTMDDSVIESWKVATGTLANRLSTSVINVAVSPDSSKIYGVFKSSYLGSLPANLSSPTPTILVPSTKQVLAMAISPDGAKMVAPTESEGALLYSVAGKSYAAIPSSNLMHVSSIAFSPDGKSLAVTGITPVILQPGSAPVGLELFNPITGAPASTPQTGSYDGTVRALAWTPDSKNITLNTLETWAPATGKTSKFSTSLSQVDGTAYTPSGTQFIDTGYNAQGGGFEIRTVGSSAKPKVFYSDLGTVSSVAISPDGKTAALATGGGPTPGVEIWNLSTLTRTASIYDASLQYVSGVAFSPDSKTLVISGSYGDPQSGTSGTVEWWTPAGVMLNTAQTGTATTNCVCYSPDGKKVYVGTEQSIQIYSPANYGLTTNYGQTGNVAAICASPGGATFAYGLSSGMVVLANTPH
jgi:hypothetical protein